MPIYGPVAVFLGDGGHDGLLRLLRKAQRNRPFGVFRLPKPFPVKAIRAFAHRRGLVKNYTYFRRRITYCRLRACFATGPAKNLRISATVASGSGSATWPWSGQVN